MQALKKSVIAFEQLSSEELEECRALAEEVVDWESSPAFWEVEVEKNTSPTLFNSIFSSKFSASITWILLNDLISD